MENQVIELDYGQVEVAVDSIGQISLIFRNPYGGVFVPLWKDYDLHGVFKYLNGEGSNAEVVRMNSGSTWLRWQDDMLVVMDVPSGSSTIPRVTWVKMSAQQLVDLQAAVYSAPDGYAKHKRASTMQYLRDEIVRCQDQLAQMDADGPGELQHSADCAVGRTFAESEARND